MTNACIVGIRTPLSTLLLIVRLLSPLQKKLYNGSMKLIVEAKELLFGIIPSSKETKLIYKFNYTTLAMRHYIYSSKISCEGIYMHELINKLSLKYNLDNIN